MASKRMFSEKIVESDAFTSMPLSAQALYFHINMKCDDDGFCNLPKTIQRSIGASDDDLTILIAKKFLIPFEDGVVLVKHWRVNNYLRKDRFVPTTYQEHLSTINIDNNGVYTLGIPMVDLDKNSIDKNSIDKNSIDKNRLVKISIEKKNNAPRTIYEEAIKEYMEEQR